MKRSDQIKARELRAWRNENRGVGPSEAQAPLRDRDSAVAFQSKDGGMKVRPSQNPPRGKGKGSTPR